MAKYLNLRILANGSITSVVSETKDRQVLFSDELQNTISPTVDDLIDIGLKQRKDRAEVRKLPIYLIFLEVIVYIDPLPIF